MTINKPLIFANASPRVVEEVPRRLLLAFSLLCYTLPWSSTAQAWGAMGHELAATLAAPYLSANARSRVDELLGNETLASAATWADRMRSNPDPFWQEQAGPYHYVTVPDGQDYVQVGAPPQGDAYTALQQFRRDLRSDTSTLERKRLALRFAIHIVQDLQQPLHAGNGRDRGGNEIRVQINGDVSNLHSVWDRQLFESTGRSQRAWLRYYRRSDLLREPTAADGDPLLWISESVALRETLYPVPAAIDEAYVQQQLPRAERRLALAAVRTAAWLNETFAGAADGTSHKDTTPASQSGWRRWLDSLFR